MNTYSSTTSRASQNKSTFEQNTQSASNAIRLVVTGLLFPTLALAYKDGAISFALGTSLLYVLILLLTTFLADLFQYLFVAIACQFNKERTTLVTSIVYFLFYTKFVTGLGALLLLVATVVK